MPSKQNREKAKRWRKNRQEKHRFEVFAMEYLKCKHAGILSEIQTLYERINRKYPERRKLTITPDFKAWKKDNEVLSSAATTLTRPDVSTTVVMSAGTEETSNQSTVTEETSIEPTVTTSTLETVTTEIMMDSSDLQLGATSIIGNENSLLDAEIQSIIEVLRDDPDLRGIMDMLEQQVEA